MTVFRTKRLDIRKLEEKDREYFIELLSDPHVIDPIPQPKWPMTEINKKFDAFRTYPENLKLAKKVIWGVFERNQKELIGLCALLTNDEGQRELGFRFRKKYWGKGLASELTEQMLNFCFEELKLDRITADVNIKNTASVRVLSKFLRPVKEFVNSEDACVDRRYELKRKDWLQDLD